MKLTIVIDKLQPKKYEWTLIFGSDSQLASGVAESLRESLVDATELFFDGFPLRDIRYCSVHIGTVSADVICNQSSEVAAWVASKYVCSLTEVEPQVFLGL